MYNMHNVQHYIRMTCITCKVHTQHANMQDVLRGAADEVLAVLKAKDVKDPEKKSGAEELLGPLPEEEFAKLVALGKRITDWVSDWASAVVDSCCWCYWCCCCCCVWCCCCWLLL